jgi:hypothetical protein
MATGNALPKGYVIPNPGPPKVIGILNIVFAAILLLYGLCQTVSILAMPMFANMMRVQQKKLEASQIAQGKAGIDAQIAELEEQAKKAQTEDEKKIYEVRIEELKARPIRPFVPNTTAGFDVAENMGVFTWADNITGILVNIPMLIAGIGLVRLKEWARTLSLATFAVKIVLLVVFCIWAVVAIVPEMTRVVNKQFDQAGAQLQAQSSGNPRAAAQGQKMLKGIGMAMGVMYTAMYIGMYGGAMIYPVIGLVVLTRPRAKAACIAASSKPAEKQDEIA